jgi:exodeoxyribonuclease-5
VTFRPLPRCDACGAIFVDGRCLCELPQRSPTPVADDDPGWWASVEQDTPPVEPEEQWEEDESEGLAAVEDTPEASLARSVPGWGGHRWYRCPPGSEMHEQGRCHCDLNSCVLCGMAECDLIEICPNASDWRPLAPVIPFPVLSHPIPTPAVTTRGERSGFELEIVPPDGMDWTAGQAAAVPQLVRTALTHGIFNLSGYAGTGKSVLLSQTVKALHQAGVPYVVLCPTGRAAARLRALGILAETIHHWRYIPDTAENGTLLGFKLREDVDIPPHFVLLLDEGSMVGPGLYGDLVDTVHPEIPGRSIIAVGDPFQLPPVLDRDEETRYGRDFCILSQGYAEAYYRQATGCTLTDVVRQAAGNPIIGLATALRASLPPPMPDGRHLLVLRRGRSYLEQQIREASAESVFLTWTNRDRRALNKVAREARGYEAALVPGERLLVLANHKDTTLCNGDLIDLVSVAPWEPRDGWRAVSFRKPVWDLTFRDATGFVGKAYALLADAKENKDEVGIFAKAQQLYKAYPEIGLPLVVDYGYCLTVHKAQGAEYDTAYIYAPDVMIQYMEADHSLRWLYTAITRAKQRVVFSGGGNLAYCLGG